MFLQFRDVLSRLSFPADSAKFSECYLCLQKITGDKYADTGDRDIVVFAEMTGSSWKGVCTVSFSTVLSATVEGLSAEFVDVEADVSNGLPIFNMVGYLSSEVKEAGERVRTAIRNAGYDYPPKRTVINLSPAALRKRGASFDLPIAVSILISLGIVDSRCTRSCLILGELGLDGKVRKIPGVLPIVIEAGKRGIKCCIVPRENEAEGALEGSVKIIGVRDLDETIKYLQGRKKIMPSSAVKCSGEKKAEIDFADICGQENVKRAAEIAVAGGHNLLLIGPPGSGKSMAAKAVAGILPPMNRDESLEITKIYSVMDMLDTNAPLISHRPFREVHHTVTRAALLGGGTVPRPGEVSLAHGGVLFLDELTEYRKEILETLRQPLENRCIEITRTYGKYRFPSDFILVAAMNPCPCGCYPDMERCRCTPVQIQNYLGKISMPFLDRIDLCTEAARVRYKDLNSREHAESSAEIRKRICRARDIQRERYRGLGLHTNAMLGFQDLKTYCRLGKKEEELMEKAFSAMKLTARAYHKIVRTARTIADLEEEENIGTGHLSEAIGYRAADGKYWGR